MIWSSLILLCLDFFSDALADDFGDRIGKLANVSKTASTPLYDKFALTEPNKEKVCPDPGGGMLILETTISKRFNACSLTEFCAGSDQCCRSGEHCVRPLFVSVW